MQESSLKSLFTDLINQITTLMRQELQLAQAEAGEKVSQAQTGLVSIIAGLLLAFSALLVLLQALVIALSNVVAPWLAAIIVGGIVAVLALVLVRQGQEKLSVTTLMPERTLKSVREDTNVVMEKVR